MARQYKNARKAQKLMAKDAAAKLLSLIHI